MLWQICFISHFTKDIHLFSCKENFVARILSKIYEIQYTTLLIKKAKLQTENKELKVVLDGKIELSGMNIGLILSEKMYVTYFMGRINILKIVHWLGIALWLTFRLGLILEKN